MSDMTLTVKGGNVLEVRAPGVRGLPGQNGAPGPAGPPGADGSDGSSDWADIQNKPSEFPPSAHVHDYSTLTGIPSTFPPSAHSHPVFTALADGFVPTPGTPTGRVLKDDGTWGAAASGSGDVVGPATSVANEVAIFSNTTGKLLASATGLSYAASVLTGPRFDASANGSAGAPAIGRGSSGFYFSGAGGTMFLTCGGLYSGLIGTTVWSIPNANYLGWESGGAGSAADLRLVRWAPNSLALRNGLNPQEFSLFNTFTSVTVYERGGMAWVGNTLRFFTEHVGANIRTMEFAINGTVVLQINNVGDLLLSGSRRISCTNLYLQTGTGAGTIVLDAPTTANFPITHVTGTITTSKPAIDITQTWNAGAVTFTGIKANITDTASAAASLLMDLQVGTVSKFRVGKDGGFAAQYGATANDTVNVNASGTMVGVSNTGGTKWQLVLAGGVDTGALRISSDLGIAWNSATTLGTGTLDLNLYRGQADVLEQRRGLNAQGARWYNTFTSGTVYERGGIQWTGNVLRFYTEQVGATDRNIEFAKSGTVILTIDGHVRVRSDRALIFDTRLTLIAQADGVFTLFNAAQSDFGRLQLGGTGPTFPAIKRNGAGIDFRVADDTAYCAIAAGITTLSGGLLFGTTNTYDIGTSTTVAAPRDINAGRNISCTGNLKAANHEVAAGNLLFWTGRSALNSPSNGVIEAHNSGSGPVSVLIHAHKVIAGTPTDADFTSPSDGIVAVDSAATKIWVRIGGAWKFATLS